MNDTQMDLIRKTDRQILDDLIEAFRAKTGMALKTCAADMPAMGELRKKMTDPELLDSFSRYLADRHDFSLIGFPLALFRGTVDKYRKALVKKVQQDEPELLASQPLIRGHAPKYTDRFYIGSFADWVRKQSGTSLYSADSPYNRAHDKRNGYFGYLRFEDNAHLLEMAKRTDWQTVSLKFMEFVETFPPKSMSPVELLDQFRADNPVEVSEETREAIRKMDFPAVYVLGATDEEKAAWNARFQK